jgi:thioredoxin 1
MSTQEFVRHVGDADFEAEVLKGDKITLVDFWAPWCGPCRALAPVLEEVAAEFNRKVNVVKVNVDDNPKTKDRYGIRSIPTLMMFKDGKVEDTVVGLVSKRELTQVIDRCLN